MYERGNSPITAAAAENTGAMTCTAGQSESGVTYEDLKDNLIALPETIGETKVVSQDANGTFTVTLLDAKESVARGTVETTKKTFGFQYTNIFGQKEMAFEVYLSCEWNNDGANSKINVLNGSYKEIGGGYKCEWVDSSYTENFCTLRLDVTKTGIGTGTYVFTAMLSTAEPKHISFDYGLL